MQGWGHSTWLRINKLQRQTYMLSSRALVDWQHFLCRCSPRKRSHHAENVLSAWRQQVYVVALSREVGCRSTVEVEIVSLTSQCCWQPWRHRIATSLSRVTEWRHSAERRHQQRWWRLTSDVIWSWGSAHALQRNATCKQTQLLQTNRVTCKVREKLIQLNTQNTESSPCTFSWSWNHDETSIKSFLFSWQYTYWKTKSRVADTSLLKRTL